MRSYSLSSAPGDAAYRISVKHEPHGVASSFLDTVLRVGTTLDVAAPRGDFVLDGEAGPVLLVSAGIGVTPVLAMLHDLAGRPSPREVWWIHAAREPADDALAAEVHGLLGVLPHAHEHVFYSATDGRLSKDKLEQLGLPAGAAAYVCGPTGFMAAMQDALTVLGVDPARIHTELFGALPASQPGPYRSAPPGAASAGRAARHRPADHVRPQRAFDPVRHQPAQRPRLRRRLRRADPLELPRRCLPHLRHPAAVR